MASSRQRVQRRGRDALRNSYRAVAVGDFQASCARHSERRAGPPPEFLRTPRREKSLSAKEIVESADGTDAGLPLRRGPEIAVHGEVRAEELQVHVRFADRLPGALAVGSSKP